MTHTPSLRTAVVLAVALLAATSAAHAADRLFVSLDGIQGPVTNKGYEGDIAAASLQWGVTNPVRSGGGAGGGSGKPTLADIAWSQADLGTVPKLTADVLSGSHIANGQFESVRSQDGAVPTYSLSVKDATVTGVAISGAGTTTSATSTLAYRQISLGYQAVRPDGSLQPALTASYDLSTGKLSGSYQPALKGASGSTVAGGIYLRLGGNDGEAIAGETGSSPYLNWIALDTASLGVSTTYGPGGLVGKPSVGDLSFTMAMNQSAPGLLAQVLSGKHLDQATIEFVDKQGHATMQLALNSVTADTFGLSEAAGAQNAEVTGSLNFASFSEIVQTQHADGSFGPATGFSYNVASGLVGAAVEAHQVAGFGNGTMGALGVAVPPVPEASPAAMLLAGLALLGGLVRRRRR